MRWSRLFIPTLRERPAEADAVSHQLLLRAGYIRPVGAGIYGYLFLAQRALNKIVAIVREEMDRIGGQEIRLPASGAGPGEAMAAIARGELRSYKQLPQIWYQIQTKFRDEPRPKSGLLRVRQFLMKDSYTFDIDAAGLEAAYRKHYEAYCRIFDRCGLRYLVVEADSGAMGGSQSHEFMVVSEAGEDWVARCPNCGYAANLERAASTAAAPALADPAGDFDPEPFHTPGRKTIAEVAEFTGLPESSQMKSLVLVADGQPVLALVRGDHQMSERKFAAALEAGEVRPAFPEEIREWFGAEAGSLGPVGLARLRIVADEALRGRRNMIAGANRDDYHLRHVTPGEDFAPEYFDLRQVAEGDACRGCGSALKLEKTVEIGHIFKLGYKYSRSMGLHVTNEAGEEVPPLMGSYGIGIERILTTAIELYHDTDGMALPAAIAPFTVIVTPVNVADATQREAAERVYRASLDRGLDALLDDRDERPGVKFKDADLIGAPWRVVTGKKLAGGAVEVVARRSREKRDVPVEEAAAFIAARVEEERVC
jgi:prolyl-tRNA synthetase